MTTSTPKIVRCPACQGDSVYAPSNPYRPFCSERCKQIDLGAWASESFAIAEPAEGAETPMADNATDPLRREPTRH